MYSIIGMLLSVQIFFSSILQVTYAEPELVTGLQGYSGGPLLGGGGPVGPGVIGMSGPTASGLNSRYVGIGSGGGSHYSSSLLQGNYQLRK